MDTTKAAQELLTGWVLDSFFRRVDAGELIQWETKEMEKEEKERKEKEKERTKEKKKMISIAVEVWVRVRAWDCYVKIRKKDARYLLNQAVLLDMSEIPWILIEDDLFID